MTTDFDAWKRRTSYVIQCYSYQIARSLTPGMPHARFKFRAKPEYRDFMANALRNAVAKEIRELMSTGVINMKIIRALHEELLKDHSGEAVACDLAERLGIPD